MPSRLATAILLALTTLVAIVSTARADEAGSLAAQTLSLGEIAGLVAIGLIPALVMILRARRDGDG